MFHYLQQHQSFSSVEEMDEHVKKHSQQQDLTKSQYAILVAISQHALATPGAAHLKAQTIADRVGVTTKTVYRAVKKLEELGMIKKLPQSKMNGIKGATIYVICPYVPSKMSERVDDESRCDCKCKKQNGENQSFSFQSFSSNKLYIAPPHNEWHEKLIALFATWPIEATIFEQVTAAIPQLPIENAAQFDRAKRIVQDVIVRVQTGTVTIQSSLVAFILGAYKKWLLPPSAVEKRPVKSNRPVPFYNWLEERA